MERLDLCLEAVKEMGRITLLYMVEQKTWGNYSVSNETAII